MRSVEADRVLAAAVAGDDAAWGSIVESHVELAWRRAVAEGLTGPDAALVCELAWLRLSQQLETLESVAEIAPWLEEMVRREAVALRAQRARQALRSGAPDNVVQLAPGFATGERAARHQLSVHQVSVQQRSGPPRRLVEPADASAAPA